MRLCRAGPETDCAGRVMRFSDSIPPPPLLYYTHSALTVKSCWLNDSASATVDHLPAHFLSVIALGRAIAASQQLC